MKELITKTINTYLNGEEKIALQTFAVQCTKYACDDNKLYKALRLLYENYATVDTQQQRCLALLSAMCYDMLALGAGYESANRCLKLVDAHKRPLGLGISESLYLQMGGEPSKLRLSAGAPTADEMSKGVEMVRNQYFTEDSSIYLLSPKHNIYCYKDKCGSLILLAVVSNIYGAILCDEECFGDNMPLYFTETDHFVSPVYRLEMAEFMLREIMRLVGYPYIRISHKVLYSRLVSSLINDEDMWEGGWFGRDLENIVIRKRPKSIPLESASEDAFPPEFLDILRETRAHYDGFKEMTTTSIHKYVSKKIHLEA